MSFQTFKPYQFPFAAMAGWDKEFNADQARAHIAPRGNVWAFLIPKKAKRFILKKEEVGVKAWDRLGRPIKSIPMKAREVLERMPPRSIVDAALGPEDVTILDLLYFNGQDVRGNTLVERLGFWWYMPDTFRNRHFYNESNSAKLSEDIFQGRFSKIIFKPEFVVYPRQSSRRKVYNWLEMRAPQKEPNEQVESAGNLSNLLLRRASPSGVTRSQEIR